MKRPRIFKKLVAELDVIVTPADCGQNIILGDPDVSDFQGYHRKVRG